MRSSSLWLPPFLLASTAILFLSLSVLTAAQSENRAPVIKLSLVLNKGEPTVDIDENAAIGSLVGIMEVTDEGEGHEGMVTCSADCPCIDLSAISPTVYKLVLAESLDFEIFTKMHVTITCADSGYPSMETTATFTILVKDMNDNIPVFTQDVYTATIPENEGNSSMLSAKPRAKDRDTGQNAKIIYILEDSNDDLLDLFEIDPHKGDIYTLGPLDHEELPEINLVVSAVDFGSPPLTGTAVVKIQVLDLNDNSPVFLTTEIQVLEGLRAMTEVSQIVATDADSGKNGEIRFSVAENEKDPSNIPPFLIGEDGTVTAAVPLDRELRDSYTIYVSATDKGSPPLSNITAIKVVVVDINDNPPMAIQPRDEYLDPEIGDLDDESSGIVSINWYCPLGDRLVYHARAVDKDAGENGRVSYFITSINGLAAGDDSLFKINPDNGEISLQRCVVETDSPTQIVTLAFRDNGTPSLEVLASLNITLDVDFSTFTSPIPTTTTTTTAEVDTTPSGSTAFMGSALLTFSSLLCFLFNLHRTVLLR